MKNSYDYEAVKSLIDDDTNITETNPLKDLFQISVKIFLILFSIYITIYIMSGIIIKIMPMKTQNSLENMLASAIKTSDTILDSNTDKEKRIRDKILQLDKKYPKTSNLDIKIISKSDLNALCYPNGNIYITSELAKELKDDEMKTFVIAHEMAHYKNRDHLMNLRKNISAASVIILLSVVSQNNNEIVNIAEGIIDISDLKYSRGVEAKADRYASEVLMKLYGNTNGGIRVMKVLDSGKYRDMEFFSTHPDIEKRIKNIKKIEKSF